MTPGNRGTGTAINVQANGVFLCNKNLLHVRRSDGMCSDWTVMLTGHCYNHALDKRDTHTKEILNNTVQT